MNLVFTSEKQNYLMNRLTRSVTTIVNYKYYIKPIHDDVKFTLSTRLIMDHTEQLEPTERFEIAFVI